jgi:hypothetical protein
VDAELKNTASEANGRRIDPTCMSHWLPRLQAAGLPVPRTILVPMSREAYRDVFNLFDGKALEGPANEFLRKLAAAAAEIGFPAFLRTGMTSGKHSWARTCYLTDPARLLSHVASLVEFSECVSFVGLPCDWWAVRELLPTTPLAVCPRYEGMPVCREFRCFVAGGEVRCMHPYWPLEALERGGVADPEQVAAQLASCPDEHEVRALAARAGAAVGGAWSVDVLETRRGWFVTDMAEAQKSWHWPDCSVAAGGPRAAPKASVG